MISALSAAELSTRAGCMRNWIEVMECANTFGGICARYMKKSPLLCRVDESYDPYFKDKYLKEEYYRLNCQVCEQLKSQRRN